MIIATKLLEWVALDILEMTKNCMMMIRRKWIAMERKIELGKREAVLREREKSMSSAIARKSKRKRC